MSTPPYKKAVPQAIRVPERPIIEPRSENAFWWERNGTFNPGVTEYHNQVVLLYRAYDDFHISRLGLAHSKDGVRFTRYNHPAIDTNPDDADERLGIEDPRITLIDGTYYIVHTVASYHAVGTTADVKGIMEHIPWRVRVAMHTTTNFKQYRHWDVLLPNVPAKNACLLPEKINGQFGLYFRENTDEGETLKLTYTTDFRQWTSPETIQWPTPETWQQFKFGTGSQPMLTKDGYLMVYHAVDQNQVYRLGLAMFDRNDPSKILWYSDPILEPELPFEKEGYVPNVVYTCGALLRNNELWIYYGAADKVIARAILPLTGLISGQS